MQGKKKDQDLADRIIHEEIMREGERLEKELGPVTFEESPDFDIEKSFEELQRKMKERDRTGEEGTVKMPAKERRKFSSVAKVLVACAAIFVCLFTFTMSSEATRMWWMKSVERLIGQESSTVVDNDDNRVKTELPENEAAAEIEEKTGIQVPEFLERPAEMQFDSYEYNEIYNFAFMYYMIGEQIIVLGIQDADTDTSLDSNYDGEILEKTKVRTQYGDVLIKKIKTDDDTVPTVVAEWNYKNMAYNTSGKVDIEVMKALIESMYY